MYSLNQEKPWYLSDEWYVTVEEFDAIRRMNFPKDFIASTPSISHVFAHFVHIITYFCNKRCRIFSDIFLPLFV